MSDVLNRLPDGTLIRSEETGFSKDELRPCLACGRSNGPQRDDCIYCGGTLEGNSQVKTKESAPPNLIDAETGFVITARGSAMDLARVFRQTGIDIKLDEAISTIGSSVPVACVGDKVYADALCDELSQAGIDSQVVSDGDLRTEMVNVRLKRIDMSPGELQLTNFNTAEIEIRDPAQLAIIVRGRIKESKTELTERRKRGRDATTLDETELTNDYSVVDVYFRGETVGFRVVPTGFDFSCLGAGISMISGVNLDRLVDRLAGLNNEVRVAADYDQLKLIINNVWEADHRRDTKGAVRSGMLKTDFGATITRSNLEQFNRFSRLQAVTANLV